MYLQKEKPAEIFCFGDLCCQIAYPELVTCPEVYLHVVLAKTQFW